VSPVKNLPASARLAALGAAAALCTTAFVGVAPAGAASGAPKPGLAGSAIVLGHHLSMSGGYADIATSKTGTAYVGWISSTSSNSELRQVHLCVLPKGAHACQNGIQSIDAIGDSSAGALKILFVAGVPTLYWMHDNEPASENGPMGSGIAAAAVNGSGVLEAGADVATAPSFGDMLDTEVAPNGQVWAILQNTGLNNSILVREGLGNAPVTVHTPWPVERALVAWDHGKAIIAVAKDGSSITTPPEYSATSGSTFPAFKKISNAWPVGTDIGLVNAGGHVRFLAGSPADYSPVVATWTGSGFTTAKSTGDQNRSYPTTHDVVADASGRMVDVENETGKIAVTNLPNDTQAAVFRFSSEGTMAGIQPQIATTPRGNGWVMWAVEEPGGTGDVLRVVPVRLSDLHRSAHKSGAHGKVTVTGPASCLPDDAISDGVSGSPDKGWKVAKKTVKLGSSKIGSTINGAALTPGKTYSLKGTVVFASKTSRAHSTVSATLKFRACPNP
jgi:hypothetical protein